MPSPGWRGAERPGPRRTRAACCFYPLWKAAGQPAAGRGASRQDPRSSWDSLDLRSRPSGILSLSPELAPGPKMGTHEDVWVTEGSSPREAPCPCHLLCSEQPSQAESQR